jgi:hypothetical protein
MVAYLAALAGDEAEFRSNRLSSPVADPGPGAGGPCPPRWLAAHVRLPDAPTRSSTWRALRELDALNVQRGVWAVRDEPRHRARLDALVAQTLAAGGRATVTEVGDTTAEDVILGSRLHRACERLWENLANQIDWHQARAARQATTFAEQVSQFTELRTRFVAVVGLDIARSQAARHTEDRLVRLGAALVEAGGTDPLRWSRSQRPVRRRVDLVTSFPLIDGRRAVVARVHPAPDPPWDLAFAGFEAFAYKPSADRPLLRAGAFRWEGPPAAEADALVAADERVQRFEANLR